MASKRRRPLTDGEAEVARNWLAEPTAQTFHWMKYLKIAATRGVKLSCPGDMHPELIAAAEEVMATRLALMFCIVDYLDKSELDLKAVTHEINVLRRRALYHLRKRTKAKANVIDFELHRELRR